MIKKVLKIIPSGLELVSAVFMEIWICEDIRGLPVKFLWIWKFDFSTICPDLTTFGNATAEKTPCLVASQLTWNKRKKKQTIRIISSIERCQAKLLKIYNRTGKYKLLQADKFR